MANDVDPMRSVVRGLLLDKQRYLHMKDENAGRKRTIAQTVAIARSDGVSTHLAAAARQTYSDLRRCRHHGGYLRLLGGYSAETL